MPNFVELRLYNPANFSDWSLLPNFSDLAFDKVYNGISAIQFSYPLDEAKTVALTDQSVIGVVLGFNDDTSAEVERFILETTSDEKVKDGIRLRSLTGRSSLAILDDAVVYPSNWPVTAPTGHEFVDATPGTIWRTLILRAKTRGTFPLVDETSFTGTVDTNSVAWGIQTTQTFSSGTSYVSILQDMMDRGIVDARMNGWDFQMYQGGTLGNHISVSTLEVKPASQVTEMVTSTESAESCSTVLIEGEEGTVVERNSAGALTLLGRRRERFVSQGGIKDSGVLTLMADAELEIYGKISAEETVGIAATNSLEPFKDFTVADWVWVRYDTDSAPVERRVWQIAVTVDESRNLEIGLTLNSILLENDIKLARKIESYAGSGSSYSSVPNSGVDLTVPNMPTSVGATSGFFTSTQTGDYVGAVTFSWVAPTTNVDGSTFADLDHYEVQWMYDGEPWSSIFNSHEISFQYSPVTPGRSIKVRVRTVDTSGNISSWSPNTTGFSHTLDSDTTAPAVPSTPTATQNLTNGIRVEYDGKTVAAANWPSDVLRIELWQSASSGFTPGVGVNSLAASFNPNLPGLAIIEGVGDDTNTYLKLVAVDRAGNRSTPSAQVTGMKLAEGTPTAGPVSSPSLEITGMPTSLLVRVMDQIEPSTDLEFHMSTDLAFVPTAGDSDTLVLTTNSRVAVLDRTPLDTVLVEGETYYIRVIAINDAGVAAPSVVASGSLDLTAVEDVALRTVVAGYILAGTIEVGDIKISSDEPFAGIYIEQPNGYIWLPDDSSIPAKFSGDIETGNLTSLSRMDIYELAQVFGTLRAVNGMTDPATAPTVFTEWEGQTAAGGGYPAYNSGLVEAIHDSNYWVTATNIAGGVFATLDKSTGQQVDADSMPANFYPTSMTRIGSSYYVLGSLGTAGGSEPWVYIFNSSFTKTGEWRAIPSGGFSNYTEYDSAAHYGCSNVRRQVIGTDGTYILLARQHTYNGLNRTVVRAINAATGSLAITVLLQITSPEDMYGIFKQSFDFGVSRYVSVMPSSFRVNSTTSIDANNHYVYVSTDNWLKPTSAGFNRGLAWDGTRFWSIDSTGNYWKFVSGHVNNSTVYARYTWYDGVGTTHETVRSPSQSHLWQARAKFKVLGQAAPEANSSAVDAAKLVRIYAGTNDTTNCRLQHASDLPANQNWLSIDALDTVSAPAPTTSTFAGTGLVPGRLEAAAKDATPENLWWFNGSGNARIGHSRWDADGKLAQAKGGITYASDAYTATGFVRFDTTATEDANFAFRAGFAVSGAAGSQGLLIPVTGVYLISAYVAFGTGTAGTAARRIVGVSKGTGTDPVVPDYSTIHLPNNSSGVSHHVGTAHLTAGEVLYLWRYTDVANHYGACTGGIRATLIG